MKAKTIRNIALSLCVVLALGVTALWASQFGTFYTLKGDLASPFDFGGSLSLGVPDVGPQDATILMQEFVLQPGVSTGWHYHKGLSYVVLLKGTIQQVQASDSGPGCTVTIDRPGSAFIEHPYEVHNIVNPGPEAAVAAWATILPKADTQNTPDYLLGMYFPPSPPSCQ